MRTVYLIRHGIAMEREEFQGSDYDRPLTPSGREKTQKAMTGLLEVIKDNQERPVLFSSGALRAKQTAEVFASVAAAGEQKATKLQFSDSVKPGANALDYLDVLIHHPLKNGECLLLFGHEPKISETVALLSNLHRFQELYERLWNSASASEARAELEHWLPSDEGELTVVEGSLAFKVKKAGAVRLELDERSAAILAILPPRALRLMAR